MPTKLIVCGAYGRSGVRSRGGCGAQFPPRLPGQKQGLCAACRERQKAANRIRHPKKKGTFTDEEEEYLRRLERITHRTSR